VIVLFPVHSGGYGRVLVTVADLALTLMKMCTGEAVNRQAMQQQQQQLLVYNCALLLL
jgi:hypothetical protein